MTAGNSTPSITHHAVGPFALLAVLAILVSAAGCGDDNNDVDPNNFQPDAANNPPNNPDNNNDGDAGTDTDADTGTPAPQCEVIDDGFSLTSGETARLQLAPAVAPNIVSCGDFYEEADLSGAYVLEFAVDNPVRLSWTIDPVAPPGNEFELPPKPLVELRRGDECGRPERVTYCGDERTSTYDLVADTRYFLVVNGELDSSFDLTLEWQELACTQESDGTCTDGAITHCVNELTVETYACVGECLDETTCEADACEAALAVDPSGGMSLAGNRAAYESSWDAAGLANCSASVSGEVGTATLGPDIFVELTGLSAGEEVTIDASQASGNYAFFIVDACDATSCLHAGALDGAFENRTTWTVPEGLSDAILIVEAPEDSPRNFDIALSSQ